MSRRQQGRMNSRRWIIIIDSMRAIDTRRNFYKHLRFDPSGCWICTLANRGDGYMKMRTGGRNSKYTMVHRYSLELHVGPIPKGLEVDHLCKNPSCCNPFHLEAVTPTVNKRRAHGMDDEGTHCKRGHLFAGNERWKSNGKRQCIECTRLLSRLHYVNRKYPIGEQLKLL